MASCLTACGKFESQGGVIGAPVIGNKTLIVIGVFCSMVKCIKRRSIIKGFRPCSALVATFNKFVKQIRHRLIIVTRRALLHTSL